MFCSGGIVKEVLEEAGRDRERDWVYISNYCSHQVRDDDRLNNEEKSGGREKVINWRCI